MDLSAEAFEDIIRRLAPSAAQEPGSELRRAPRLNQRARASISVVENGVALTRWQVQVCNISLRGMGFLNQNRFRPAEQFVIWLARQDEQPLTILSTVMHCRGLAKGLYYVGAEFTCVVPMPAEVQDVTDLDRIRQSILG